MQYRPCDRSPAPGSCLHGDRTSEARRAMNTGFAFVTERRVFVSLLALSLITLSGCANVKSIFGGFGERDATAYGDQSDAILATARARQVNMFGDLGENEETTYFSRSAVSVKQHTFTEVGRDIDPDLDSWHLFLIIIGTLYVTIANWQRTDKTFDIITESEQLWNSLEILLRRRSG